MWVRVGQFWVAGEAGWLGLTLYICTLWVVELLYSVGAVLAHNLVGVRVSYKKNTVEAQSLLGVNSGLFLCFALEKQRRLDLFKYGQCIQK